MKAPDVEGEVEGTCDAVEFGHITHLKFGFDVLVFEFVPCNTNGARRKIDASYLPA